MLTVPPSNSLLRYLHKRTRRRPHRTALHNFIPNSHMLKQPQRPSTGVDKAVVLKSHSGILLSDFLLEKNNYQYVTTRMNCKNPALRERNQDFKKHVLCKPIYVNSRTGETNLWWQKWHSVCPQGWGTPAWNIMMKFSEGQQCSTSRLVSWLHSWIQLSKLSKLYTSYLCISLYVHLSKNT